MELKSILEAIANTISSSYPDELILADVKKLAFGDDRNIRTKIYFDNESNIKGITFLSDDEEGGSIDRYVEKAMLAPDSIDYFDNVIENSDDYHDSLLRTDCLFQDEMTEDTNNRRLISDKIDLSLKIKL